MQQKAKLSPQRLIIGFTGVLFAAYAGYYVYVYCKDNSELNTQAKFISLLVAVLFTVLALYALSHAVKRMKGIRFLIVRKAAFIIALIALLGLKLRMFPQVAEYWHAEYPFTILYAFAYAFTVAALLLLLIYYAFIRKATLFLPKTAVIIPAAAAFCFFCSFVLDAILFFAFHVMLEANTLRTVVMRPVFYLGFISLCMYFLFPPKEPEIKPARPVKPQATK